MKAFKFIFILFVILIVIYSSYRIYKNQRAQTSIIQTQEEEEDVVIIKDLRLGICNYDSMNPLITNNREIIDIDTLIFDPLFTITKDYKIEPCLATECSKTGDTTYVVKIDTNVKWHDDTYLTAKDIKFTIDTIKEGNSIYKYNVENIANTEVLDASTIKLTLTNSVPFFEYNLTFPILNNMQYAEDNLYTSTQIPLGTGRFKIVNINNNSVNLIKNKQWRKIVTDESKIENIKIAIFPSMGGVFNGFKLGNIDLFRTDHFNYQDYIGTIGFNVTEYPGRDFDFLSCNCEDHLLKDKYVRQAINYAIDRNSLVATVYGTTKIPAYYSLDYGNYLYTKDNSLNYNFEKAKSILEEHGWVYENNQWMKEIDNQIQVLELNLSVQAQNEARYHAANEIKNQLANIGIQVNVIGLSNTEYDHIFETRNFQLLLTGIYNSLTPNVNYLLNDGNIGGYHNDEVTSILNSQVSTKNDKLIVDGYRKVYEFYKEDMPYIGLYRGKNIIISTQSMAGTVFANNYNMFYNIATWYRR